MINTLKEKVEIIECSAKDNINITEAFISLIDKMIELGLGRIEDDDESKHVKSFMLDNTNYRNRYRGLKC